MGHYVDDLDRMFRNNVYQQKTTVEIREALERKLDRIGELLSERSKRIDEICRTFEISDSELTNLVLKHQEQGASFTSFESQSDRSKAVPAGAIANIVQEKKMIESEKSQLGKIEMVLRNLQETEYYNHPESGALETRESIHRLSDLELEYLGF